VSLFPTSVHVEGLNQMQRDFGKLSKNLKRELQGQLRKLALPAADLIRREATGHRFSPRSVEGIRPGTTLGNVVVREARGKVTGKRPDYGSILYRLAFFPGAEEAEPIVRLRVEQWLGDITEDFNRGRTHL
jgi:hypothetical protein